MARGPSRIVTALAIVYREETQRPRHSRMSFRSPGPKRLELLSTPSTEYRGLSNWNRVLGPIIFVMIIRNQQNSISNYLGPYIQPLSIK